MKIKLLILSLFVCCFATAQIKITTGTTTTGRIPSFGFAGTQKDTVKTAPISKYIGLYITAIDKITYPFPCNSNFTSGQPDVKCYLIMIGDAAYVLPDSTLVIKDSLATIKILLSQLTNILQKQ